MTPFNEYWLETGAAVPVDIETTAILLREIQRLRSEEQKPVAFRNINTGEFCTGGFLRKDWAKWQPLYAAPVHASENAEKQEPVAWFTDDHREDKSATTYSKRMAERWKEKGWPVTPLYTAPVHASDISQECVDETAKDRHEPDEDIYDIWKEKNK